MNKNMHTTLTLEKGVINIYNFGNIRLHAYKTNDFIDNEVFLVEKNGTVVLIESPCFFDNNKELETYISQNNLSVAGILLAYHMGGGSFLPGVKKYATKNADIYGHTGGGAALIQNFTKTFGPIFDSKIHTVTDYLEPGKITIGGIDFVIFPNEDAFDIEIPEINAIYIHMLGHDCHSIVAGPAHADAIIQQLNEFIRSGYDFILTSHYTPENLKDVKTKISYLEELKHLAKTCTNAQDFKALVKQNYPAYSGENYLDMTAGFFFP